MHYSLSWTFSNELFVQIVQAEKREKENDCPNESGSIGSMYWVIFRSTFNGLRCVLVDVCVCVQGSKDPCKCVLNPFGVVSYRPPCWIDKF